MIEDADCSQQHKRIQTWNLKEEAIVPKLAGMFSILKKNVTSLHGQSGE